MRARPDMTGRICLVTGASSGIGRATALALARAGATLIGVGRDRVRCEKSAEAIKRESGNYQVEFWQADLSIQEEVRAVARRFQAVYPRLDLLVNNAGGRFARRLTTPEGLEMTFALNHLGYFLLTLLLLERLRLGERPRVVNVVSAAHRGCPGIDFDDLNLERGYDGRRAYAQSKLANLLFTYELARRLEGSGITANAAAPGNVLTRFSMNNGLGSWLSHVAGSLKSGGLVGPRRGARTVLHLACAGEVAGRSGGYWAAEREGSSSPASYDLAAAERLWRASLELTGLAGQAREGRLP
ncbi:SDR family NAD(P)-dependent oxidoreductase [Geomonas nitrogeniifigens]|uniref:SDR family NAD(P)-dependent oxidoreductase n=1 Tax=Geomonas diazotrophica TaxID=2843197 RepID=A0ABX8JG41_9BACT|nr:SDR family NAD(P)-dependent oxidoreductase [Geomonas nitrogeniifigens]QWV96539.1 SDR family NAD(P)-dependent oxidoreductase [Geomonas nitrogeniifigens]QXE85644.1 SDR family NAD(P)-dependent oxidoreductase [Geomonas nitrogeniifigens]